MTKPRVRRASATAAKKPARARRSAKAWDKFLTTAPKRGTDRILGRFLIENWKIIGPVVVWIVAQLIGYNVMRADLAATKVQVSAIYSYVLWGQRPNVGPPPPLEKHQE